MSALAERVEGALAAAGDAERRAFERRERGGASYAEIAGELGVGREQVAALIVSARLQVSAAMGDPIPSAVTPICTPARCVLAAEQDGEAVSENDLRRAREHLDGCEPCRTARRGLREAALASRSWRGQKGQSPLSTEVVAPSRRRRPVAIAAAALVALVLLVVALGGGGEDPVPPPAAPTAAAGSADAPGTDVVPEPGDRFCPEEEPNCR